MTLGIDEILGKSFVISIDDSRLDAFYGRFSKEGLFPLPRKFRGFQYRNTGYRSAGIVKTHDAANVRMGNIALVKMAEALDWPFICIFEDDAKPCIGAKDKLDGVLKSLPDSIDMLKMGWLSQKDTSLVSDTLVTSTTLGSHAYIVFKQYYGKFQDTASYEFLTDGTAMNDANRRIFCTKEMLFMQDDR